MTQKFVDAAHKTGKIRLTAVYSRTLLQAQQFGGDAKQLHYYDSLKALVQSPHVDAVYIASPNSLHYPQALLCLQNGKHVICKKPLAANAVQVQALITLAQQKQCILFEAFKTEYLPNFTILQRYLPQIGKLRHASFQYCQYSSRYPRYLSGELPNTFNPAFANGSIMDIGFYCVASSVALWGKPQHIIAAATLLDSGVDGEGTAILRYASHDTVITHSKVSDSYLDSEIQGEAGALVIEHLSECDRVTLRVKGAPPRIITIAQDENAMRYEAAVFAQLITQHCVAHHGLQRALTTSQIITEIRRQTGVIFPDDSTEVL